MLLLFVPLVNGQQNDAGFWASVTIKKQVTRKFGVNISEQIRLYQNVSEIEQIFTDLGAEYAFTSSFKAAFNYRMTKKNEQTYYSTRHRFYLDVSYRYKAKPFVFTVRERIQRQVEEVNSSETGKIPVWYLRSKLAVKLDLDKKYSPYVSAEVAYLIDNVDETDQVFDKARYEVGVDYEFDKRSSLNLFYLIQSDLIENKTRDFVSGVGYTYSF